MELGNAIFGNSRGDFPVNREWQNMFCDHLRNMGFDGYGRPTEEKNWHIIKSGLKTIEGKDNVIKEEYQERHEVFENDVFWIMPYHWGDDEYLCSLPNFIYKPTGFTMTWYKYALRDSYANEGVSYEQLEDMLLNCKRSLGMNIGQRERDEDRINRIAKEIEEGKYAKAKDVKFLLKKIKEMEND